MGQKHGGGLKGWARSVEVGQKDGPEAWRWVKRVGQKRGGGLKEYCSDPGGRC